LSEETSEIDIKRYSSAYFSSIIFISTFLRRMTMTVAKIGDIIEFHDGLQGVVEKINENSVIVDCTYMENFEKLEIPERTVINHKRYKIIHEA